MDAALHSSNGDACKVADYEISGVTDGGAARESGNLDVWYVDSMMELVREPAEAGAEDDSDACAKWGVRQNGLRGVFGVEEFVEVDQGVVRQQQSSRIATNIFTTKGAEDTEKALVASHIKNPQVTQGYGESEKQISRRLKSHRENNKTNLVVWRT
jgi:hypothetical protein